VRAPEETDRHIVGPLREALPAHGGWRMLVSPDHSTPLRTRAHAHGMVPFVLAATGIVAGGQPYYDEAVAEVAGLAFEKRHELTGQFLGPGVVP
jgi:2,3-bisphosphoglycerate-independent phosphoglycerate mutase